MSDDALKVAKVFAEPLFRIAAAIPIDIDRASRGKLERSLETISDAIADLPGNGDFEEDFAALIRETMKPGVGEDDGCEDCNRPYGDEHGFPDMIIPDEQWKAISTTGTTAGLLCPSCILARLHAADQSNVSAHFVSGPCRLTPTAEAERLSEVMVNMRADFDTSAAPELPWPGPFEVRQNHGTLKWHVLDSYTYDPGEGVRQFDFSCSDKRDAVDLAAALNAVLNAAQKGRK